jgi:MFS family permease
LVIGVAVNRLASFVELFLVLYLISGGRSAKAAGLALTAFGAGAVFGVLCGGRLAMRIGGRLCIVVSMVSAGTGTALLTLVDGLLPVVALSAAIGAATQLFRPAAMSMLSAAAMPEELVMVMAGYRFGLNVGAMLTPLLGAALAAFSWDVVFLVDAASSLLFAFVAFRTLPRDRLPPGRGGDTTEAGPTRPLRDHRFVLVAIGLFLAAAVEVQYVATLPLEIHFHEMPTAVYSAMVTLNGLLVIVVEPSLTTRIRRWPIRRSLCLGIALIGLGVAGYGLPGGLVTLALATLVWTLGEMVGAPAAAAYPSLAAPPAAAAPYVAVTSAAQNVGYAVGPVLGVALYAGSPWLCWLLCAGVGLSAAAVTWVGTRSAPRDRG